MSDSFDPYHVWLGIPPESRPPTHYQLLGISPDETERAVIEAAVLRQSGYVRNFQIGKYAKDAARILNEIAAAKACLLDPAKRVEYDAELKANQAPIMPQAYQARPPVLFTPAIDIDQFIPASMRLSGDLIGTSVGASRPLSGTRPSRGAARRPRRSMALPNRPRTLWQALAGFASGVAITLLVVALWPTRAEQASPPSAEPLVLGGSVRKVASPNWPADSSPLELSAGATPAPARESAIDHGAPQVLQILTQSNSPTVASYEDSSFFVGTTEWGWGAVGYELRHAHRVVLACKISEEAERKEKAFARFILDFHTSAGYSDRVALVLCPLTDQSQSDDLPEWGKHVRPDRFVDLSETFAFNERKYLDDYPDIAAGVAKGTIASGQEHWQRAGRHEGRNAVFGATEIHELDLDRWAPKDWDGNAWFSVVLSTSNASAIEGGSLNRYRRAVKNC